MLLFTYERIAVDAGSLRPAVMSLLMKVLTTPAYKEAHVCMCSVQVMHELLRQDPEGGSIADDEGYLPIEIAADKACEQPSEVMSLVMKMLSEPAEAGMLCNMRNQSSLAIRISPGIMIFMTCSHYAATAAQSFGCCTAGGSQPTAAAPSGLSASQLLACRMSYDASCERRLCRVLEWSC